LGRNNLDTINIYTKASKKANFTSGALLFVDILQKLLPKNFVYCLRWKNVYSSPALNQTTVMQCYRPILAILFLIVSVANLFAQITLSTQAEVDAWDQSITVLTDSVIIVGSDITNIDALSGLTDIADGYELKIKSNPNLIDIDGLLIYY